MGRAGLNGSAEGAAVRQFIHSLDWIAAVILAIALTPYIPGVVQIFNVIGNLWGYTIVVTAAVAWTIARVVFKRLHAVAP